MKPIRQQPSYTVLDLFCGAGGVSLGMTRAGFTVRQAIDFNRAAVATYRENFGDHVAALDLSASDLDLPTTDVITGGPPCQGFSSAGLRRSGDPRNSLVSAFASHIVRLRPRAFIFENVEGFLTAENGERVLELLEPLVDAGYRIHLRKVNAANYGVPQHRKRVVGIGGLRWNPSFPAPTHTAFGAPGALNAGRHLPRTPTVEQSLEGLAQPTRELPGDPQGHFAHELEGDDLRRAIELRPGNTMRDLPAELQHDSYRRRSLRRVMDGTPSEKRGGAPAGVRRLYADQPSKAITSGARGEFLHPVNHRYVTLRECARLQTFPDDFVFRGTQAEQDVLVGNAVPPRFAESVARSLSADLDTAAPTFEKGALLSFVPTMAEGMSPALARTLAAVEATFPEVTPAEELKLWG